MSYKHRHEFELNFKTSTPFEEVYEAAEEYGHDYVMSKDGYSWTVYYIGCEKFEDYFDFTFSVEYR